MEGVLVVMVVVVVVLAVVIVLGVVQSVSKPHVNLTVHGSKSGHLDSFEHTQVQ